MPLNEYVQRNFYDKIGMTTTGFLPLNRFSVDRIAPTEDEKHFRLQWLQGDVHDEGSAMFGGVAGHAGLFSDAYDLAMLYQMLLNGGEINGRRYLKPETIKYFTAYHSDISRRGYGFDKPEKDNATVKSPIRARMPLLKPLGILVLQELVFGWTRPMGLFTSFCPTELTLPGTIINYRS